MVGVTVRLVKRFTARTLSGPNRVLVLFHVHAATSKMFERMPSVDGRVRSCQCTPGIYTATTRKFVGGLKGGSHPFGGAVSREVVSR